MAFEDPRNKIGLKIRFLEGAIRTKAREIEYPRGVERIMLPMFLAIEEIKYTLINKLQEI